MVSGPENHEHGRDELRYMPLDQMDFQKTFQGFRTLSLLQKDTYLRMQAFNLQIIDEWTTQLEYQVLRELQESERTPHETFFLNAQSQMWIMAVYEVLRTWRQRVRKVQELVRNGSIEQEIERLRKETDYFHPGVESRIRLLEFAAKDAGVADQIDRDIKRVHIPFRRIEAVRINLAKHEIRGKKDSIANMPGYGRINMWCGSLDYELSVGRYVLGTISRRDVAESIRALVDTPEPPSNELIASFDEFMKGPSDEAAAQSAPQAKPKNEFVKKPAQGGPGRR